MRAKNFLLLCTLSIFAMAFAGCASTPKLPTAIPVQVVGNGKCKPPVDLPAHKTMKKVPVVDTFLDEAYSLLGIERHDHAKDITDYNSLYDVCVDKSGASTPAATK